MTNNEIATTGQSTEIATPSVSATGLSLAQQVRDMADAHQLAQSFATTSFAGPFKGKPDDLAVAILKGNSLGIPAHEVGGKIYVVHGTPAMYGKTSLAIAKAHGYRIERLIYGPTEVSIKVHSPNGDQDTITYTYTRAEKEGLVKGNSAQYKTRPEKMLWWKCVGEAADQVWPHLMSGMPLKEDWEQSEPIQATAERVDKAPAKAPESVVDAVPELAPGDALDAVAAVIRSVTTVDELNELVGGLIKPHLDDFPDDREAVMDVFTEKKEEING